MRLEEVIMGGFVNDNLENILAKKDGPN